ncbi:MAG: TIGR00296 family protein [Candidatus Altarchaeaceae archaeon]
MELSLDDGKFLVKFAREVIEKKFLNEEVKIEREIFEKYKEKSGIFVTIEEYPSKELRGCIGYIEPIFPLIYALKEAAIQAGFNDPRFLPLEKEELNNVVIEVTVLTKPELIKDNPENYEKHIEIGRDGLIVERKFHKGVLLPQVPIEWNWNKKEFLEHTCLKAGLNHNAYKDKETKVYKFQGKIFSEISPNGDVIIKDLKNRSCKI